MEGIVYLAKTKEDAFKFVALRYIIEDIAIIELESFDHNQKYLKQKLLAMKMKLI